MLNIHIDTHRTHIRHIEHTHRTHIYNDIHTENILKIHMDSIEQTYTVIYLHTEIYLFVCS